MTFFLLSLYSFFFFSSCSYLKRLAPIETNQYVVVQRLERPEPLYYTQGFLFKDDTTLLESSGLYGESTIHYIDLISKEIIKETRLGTWYFGEGCDLVTTKNSGAQIFQLTWRERKIFSYDPESLDVNHTFPLPEEISEGWGLTHISVNGSDLLLISDGSDKIFFVDPDTFKVTKTLKVIDENERPIRHLNELEVVNGTLLANVYLTNKIVAIDLNNGKIKKSLNFDSLVKEVRTSKIFQDRSYDTSYCLNGIAYNPNTDMLLVTGKKWPIIYEIKLKEPI